MAHRNISIFTKIAIYITMLVFTVLTIYPLVWVIIQSFKTNMDYMMNSRLALPQEWYFGHYQVIWNQWNFFNFFQNSVIYTSVTVIMVVLLSNMAGFAFAKIDFKITKWLLGLFIMGLLLTLQSILVPLFLMVNAVGLINTRLGVLIPYIGLGLPMAVYLNTDFIKNGIPSELMESAEIDGASLLKVYRKIILPMSSPVIITIAIITFVATWNEFIIMNILTTYDGLRSIPTLVGRFAGSLGTNWGVLFTILSLSLVPMLVFYFIFRNKITQGIAAGAIKG